MKFISFPKDFWWGAATSGPQSEGTFDKKPLTLQNLYN